MKRIKEEGFEMEVDDAWVERWDPDIARQYHMSEDECFAALRVTFTLTRQEAIELLGEDNLPGLPVKESAVSCKELPHNGEMWKIVKVEG